MSEGKLPDLEKPASSENKSASTSATSSAHHHHHHHHHHHSRHHHHHHHHHRHQSQMVQGCGCNSPAEASNMDTTAKSSVEAGGQTSNSTGTGSSTTMSISITPTTGGQFELQVNKSDTVEILKKQISKKLKVAKERICLLYRERQLRFGTLEENCLQDGSRLTLLPSVETGLLAQRPEQSVMQALESLSDSQVNDFLSGKAPLNLTMRLGDHMMLIQLQLSTVTPTSTTTPAASSSTLATTPVASSGVLNANSTAQSTSTAGAASSDDSGNGPTQQPCLLKKYQQQPHQQHQEPIVPGALTSSVKAANSDLTGAHITASSIDGSLRRSPGKLYSSIPSTGLATAAASCGSDLFTGTSFHQSHSASTANPEHQHIHRHHHQQSSLSTSPNGLVPAAAHQQPSLHHQQILPQQSSSTSSSLTSQFPTLPASSASLLDPLLKQAFPSLASLEPTLSSSASTRLRQAAAAAAASTFSSRRYPYPNHHQSHHRSKKSTTQCTKTHCTHPDCESSNTANNSTNSSSDISCLNLDRLSKCTADLLSPLRSTGTSSSSSSSSSQCECLSKTPKKPKPPCLDPLLMMPQASSMTASQLLTTSASAAMLESLSSQLSSATAALPRSPTINPPSASSGSSSSSELGCPSTPTTPEVASFDSILPPATLDTRALVEASRSLTRRLKQLSSEENSKRRQGAIIESMRHHGKGVYTGTFSGTLNPALQDKHGRPKRDISTIIHILNDLLCATPASSGASCYRYDTKSSSSSSSSTALESASSTTVGAGVPQPRSSSSQASRASSLLTSAAAATSTSVNVPQLFGSQPSNGAVTGLGGSEADMSTDCSGSLNSECSAELSKENEATKGKMRRLRLVMEQRRAKIRARREARAAPYTTQWAAVTPDPNPNESSSSATTNTSSSEAPAQPPEPCTSPEPVVA